MKKNKFILFGGIAAGAYLLSKLLKKDEKPNSEGLSGITLGEKLIKKYNIAPEDAKKLRKKEKLIIPKSGKIPLTNTSALYPILSEDSKKQLKIERGTAKGIPKSAKSKIKVKVKTNSIGIDRVDWQVFYYHITKAFKKHKIDIPVIPLFNKYYSDEELKNFQASTTPAFYIGPNFIFRTYGFEQKYEDKNSQLDTTRARGCKTNAMMIVEFIKAKERADRKKAKRLAKAARDRDKKKNQNLENAEPKVRGEKKIEKLKKTIKALGPPGQSVQEQVVNKIKSFRFLKSNNHQLKDTALRRIGAEILLSGEIDRDVLPSTLKISEKELKELKNIVKEGHAENFSSLYYLREYFIERLGASESDLYALNSLDNHPAFNRASKS